VEPTAVKRRLPVALMTLVLHSVAVVEAVGQVEVLGLRIGVSDLHSTLLALGQPKAVYLAASGPDGMTLSHDNIILEYEQKLELAGERGTRVFVECDESTYLVESVRIELTDVLENAEGFRAAVEEAYGKRYSEFRRKLICDEGETECTLSECRAADGDVLVWRFAAKGLEVQMHTQQRRVSASLLFAPAYTTEVIPECSAGS